MAVFNSACIRCRDEIADNKQTGPPNIIAFSPNSGYKSRTEYCGYRAAARRLARAALPSWSYAK
jgi:hypothetical protein